VVTATWYNRFALPTTITETASLDVDWDGSSWQISNTSTSGSNILQLATAA
jgi:hypothetical protein